MIRDAGTIRHPYFWKLILIYTSHYIEQLTQNRVLVKTICLENKRKSLSHLGKDILS